MDLIDEWVWFYYNKGFSIFPVKSTIPPSPDNKTPNLPSWKEYMERRPTEDEIKKWLKNGTFQNIAIVCGAVSGNLVVIDIDDPKIVGELGLDLDKLMDEKGVWVQCTGKQGHYHLFSLNNTDPGGRQSDPTHVEYRGNGCYVVSCPSIHPNGISYHFLNYETPDKLPPLKQHDVKAVYLDMVTRLRQIRGIQPITAAQREIIEGIEADCIKNIFKGGIKEGNRNDTAFILANWYKNIKKMNPTEIRTLLINWNKKNKPPLPASELNTVVTSAMKSDKKTGCKKSRELGYCPYPTASCTFIKKQGKEKLPIIEKPFFFNNDMLFEQIYDDVTYTTRYVYFDEGQIRYVDEWEYCGMKYVPIQDKDAIEMGAVYFPSEPKEYESLQVLMQDINDFIYRYVDIPDTFRMFCIYYILFSWVTDKIHTVPYLRVIADFGTGKTRFLDTVGRLCYRPIIVAGATTPASIFRSIQRWKGTLLVDEFTLKESGEEEDIIKIFNCGFEKGYPVTRCNKENNKLEYFDTFGPKVISSRREFQDHALNSRCITETLVETRREDIPTQLPRCFYEEQKKLRNKLLMFRLKHWDDLDPDKIQGLRFPKNISGRMRQAFSSFAVLFSHDEAAFDLFMDFIKKYNKELTEERSTSFDGILINSYFELKKEGYSYVTSKLLSEKMAEKGITKKDGSTVSPTTVGRHLKILGVKTVPKIVDEKTYRAVVEDVNLFEMLKRKYVVEEVKDDQQRFF